MFDSQARIVESPRRIGIPTGEAGDAERAVSFRFEVLWSSLFVALDSAKAPPPPMIPSPISAAPNVSEGTNESVANGSGSFVQWEMVVPKMVRPSARISPSNPQPLPQIPPQPADHPRGSDPEHNPAPPPEYSAAPERIPKLAAEPSRWFRLPRASPITVKVLLGGVLIAGVAVPVAMRINRFRPHAAVDAEVHGGGWTREPSAPVGAKQARQLVLYRPSLGATDCRLEFTWKVNDRPLGWTFRAKDKDNYYAMGIKALRPGPSPTLSVEHFTVYQGVESQHANKVLILTGNGAALQVRMEVTGATFKLYLDGTAADYWTDNRLAAGGLGFLEQPDQPADVQSVRMSFSQTGGA